ncbi:hypothetical protein [Xenorhabdus bovienii]|uniref:hypothetical protein n=1 Tax=Xenorhabdus bovienii TaxID=40576 RepID=UPI0023B3227B|nr:hypothetical protein [Xenorhabdus bovienii]MDE9437397.1 hypothetical protein [Xenorhabdus bovienii]MDE9462605.1 hypothetical protein [Xenorhabdus bovienii]MDE9464648.1 hypothetical protein [Xenorhabdus bovienii]MDE9467953.1 hypothetical protein [Xenorhabdus bovienii]MDE9499254.1 hypothetical protein [Xenorhabdus bovienii]
MDNENNQEPITFKIDIKMLLENEKALQILADENGKTVEQVIDYLNDLKDQGITYI